MKKIVIDNCDKATIASLAVLQYILYNHSQGTYQSISTG